MPIQVNVELLCGSYRGRAVDQDRTSWPPSPVRMLGALLAGAHSLDGSHGDTPTGKCADARRALEQITTAPPPLIVTPEAPVELADTVVWFAPRDAGDSYRVELSRLVRRPAVLSSSNLVSKPRTVSLLPLGNVIRFNIDTDIDDEQLWSALASAAAAVPFFGSSADPAQITVERVETYPEPEHGEHLWRPVPAAAARTAPLRCWTPATVSWFDDNHIHRGAPVADWRVTTTNYTQRPARILDPGSPENGHFHMLTLPAPITMLEYADRLAGVQGWKNADILPAVEFNAPDRVRGFGLYGPRVDELLDSAPDDLIGGDFPGSFHAWEPATWVGPSRRWVSATPTAAHRDPRAARVQIETQLERLGLRLTALSHRPFKPWHIRRLRVPVHYGLWFLTAEVPDLDSNPISGPLRIGECQSSGAGLLTPDRTSRARR